MTTNNLQVIDLFAGVGGLSQGFQQAGCDVVLALEYDQSIAEAYAFNHTNTLMINKDIRLLDFNNIFYNIRNKVDIVIGGPPCQGFSQKGKRKTIDDERNYLFKYFIDAVRFVNPNYFLMENVPELLTSEDGLFKKQIIDMFSKCGYSVDCGILNAYDFGVPQNRRRAFILGKLGGDQLLLPKGNSHKVTIGDAIGDLEFLESGEGEEVQDYRFDARSQYQIEMRMNSKKLFNHTSTHHSPEAIEKMKMIPYGKGKEIFPAYMLTKSIYSGTWSRMIENEPSVTITTRFDTPSSGRFIHPKLNRCITIREAARCQSFPDSFRFLGNKSSQMKQVGNAVPPRLAKSIAGVIVQDQY